MHSEPNLQPLLGVLLNLCRREIGLAFDDNNHANSLLPSGTSGSLFKVFAGVDEPVSDLAVLSLFWRGRCAGIAITILGKVSERKFIRWVHSLVLL
jgi:hypothetical protein